MSLQRLRCPQGQCRGWHTPPAPSHWTPHPKQGRRAPQTLSFCFSSSVFIFALQKFPAPHPTPPPALPKQALCLEPC